MTEVELKNLQEDGERRMKLISHAVREVFSPQIRQHGEGYHEYLKDISTMAGLLLGGIVALWSTTSVLYIKIFSILSFTFLSLAVVLSFWLRKTAIIRPVPYIQYLKKLSRWMTEHSNKIVLFSRGEKSLDEHLREKEDFSIHYQKMRDGARFKDLEEEESMILDRMPKWYSEVNILTTFFVAGILLVLLSVLLPQICIYISF